MNPVKKILVINPNSNERVTGHLREALADLSSAADIQCCTLADGPFGIESDADVVAAAGLLVEKIPGETNYDAFVIACYSDPGLTECRQVSSKPVYGMQESALKAAARGNRRFGVLALSEASVARHLPYIENLGLSDQLAAELPLGITVDQSAGDPATLDKVIDNGRRLVDEFGAEAVVLGCAGMAALRKPAEQALSVPVFEPVREAVNDAIQA